MRTSESILKLIESNEENKTIKTGHWKATKTKELIEIYYYNTLVGEYYFQNNVLLMVYDYSVSTKCGLTKILNLLKRFNLVKLVLVENRYNETIDLYEIN